MPSALCAGPHIVVDVSGQRAALQTVLAEQVALWKIVAPAFAQLGRLTL